VKLYPVLKQNIAIFRDQIGKHVDDLTAGDQYGPLMAGAYLLEHDEPVEPVDAYEAVRSYDWTNFGKPHKSERDERRCLDTILGVLVPAQAAGHSEKPAIGELIRLVHGDLDSVEFGISVKEAQKSLARHGIKAELDGVCVANHAAELEKLLPQGPWRTWAQHLKRLPGATTPEDPVWFAGGTQRYTRLPWDLFPHVEA
jgi:putative DNA primase/helicase